MTVTVTWMSILLPPSPLCVTIPLPLLLLLPADITSCLELEEVLGGGTGGVANLGPSVMSFDRFGFVSKDVSDLVGLLLLLLLLEVMELDLTAKSLSLLGNTAVGMMALHLSSSLLTVVFSFSFSLCSFLSSFSSSFTLNLSLALVVVLLLVGELLLLVEVAEVELLLLLLLLGGLLLLLVLLGGLLLLFLFVAGLLLLLLLFLLLEVVVVTILLVGLLLVTVVMVELSAITEGKDVIGDPSPSFTGRKAPRAGESSNGFFLFSSCSRILASSCASFFGVNVFSRMDVRRTDCVRVLECARRILLVWSCSLLVSSSLISCMILSRSSASSQMSYGVSWFFVRA